MRLEKKKTYRPLQLINPTIPAGRGAICPYVPHFEHNSTVNNYVNRKNAILNNNPARPIRFFLRIYLLPRLCKS